MKKRIVFAVCLLLGSTSADARYRQTGTASWYGPGFYGKKTASGEVFTGRGMTAAQNTLPLGSRVRVTYKHRSVVLRVTDRGNFGKKYHRIIDVSPVAARRLHPLHAGTGKVTVVVLGRKHKTNF